MTAKLSLLPWRGPKTPNAQASPLLLRQPSNPTQTPNQKRKQQVTALPLLLPTKPNKGAICGSNCTTTSSSVADQQSRFRKCSITDQHGTGNGACHPVDDTFSQPYGGGNGALPSVCVTFSQPYSGGSGAFHPIGVSFSQPYGAGNGGATFFMSLSQPYVVGNY